MTKLTLALGAAALALAACNQGADGGNGAGGTTSAAAPAKPVPPPAGKQWSEVVSELPDGGYRMGNPDAPVKLVEYLSLTCPHCAEFGKEGFEKVRDGYVNKGTVSFEVRNYVFNQIDMALTLMSRCAGPEPYFALTEQALASQPDLLDRMKNLTEAQAQALQSAPIEQQLQGVARVMELYQFAKQRGISEEKLNACFADTAEVDQLVTMQRTANEQLRIPGTPTFLLNGQILENVGTWETLEPKLKAAGA